MDEGERFDPVQPTRRAVIAAAGGTVALRGVTALAAEPALATPALDFVFEARVLIGAPIEQGMIDGLRRRIIPITGGTFAGPRVSGEILPGGADWQAIRPDGTALIDTRYTLKAADGTIIEIENAGFRRGPSAVLQRLAAGEDVDPALYYFRTAPRFRVAEGPHRWLAENIFVANAARYRDHVRVRIFVVT